MGYRVIWNCAIPIPYFLICESMIIKVFKIFKKILKKIFLKKCCQN